MRERSRGKGALDHLEERLKEIRRYRIRFSLQVLGVNALIYACILTYTRDIQRTNFLYTSLFQYQCVVYICWWMLPYFLRVEAKQDVSLAMGHDSVDILDKIDSSIETRLAKLDRILERADRVSASIDAGDHALVAEARASLKEMRDHMKAIRARVERDTAPLPTSRRPIIVEIPDGNGPPR